MKARHMLAMVVTTVLSATAAVAQEEKKEAAPAAQEIAIEGKDGKTIQAEVLSADEDSVKIRRADGKEFDLPFARLSDAGTAAVKKVIAEREAEVARLKAEEEDEKKPGVRPKIPDDPKTPDDLPEKFVVKKGQTVIVRFSLAEDGLARPKIIKEVPQDRSYMQVEFKDGDPLTAALTSTFPKTLKLRCLAKKAGETTYNEITIVPLKSGTPSFETWSDPYEELVFFDFVYLE
ncbi:hypothetical protein [Luteolibacter soli]|uniref:Uncharacterized protein n=1 Tax=Luteolibacter soli TaxID=3135280 RepID=A0ABU9ARY5_9BACT